MPLIQAPFDKYFCSMEAKSFELNFITINITQNFSIFGEISEKNFCSTNMSARRKSFSISIFGILKLGGVGAVKVFGHMGKLFFTLISFKWEKFCFGKFFGKQFLDMTKLTDYPVFYFSTVFLRFVATACVVPSIFLRIFPDFSEFFQISRKSKKSLSCSHKALEDCSQKYFNHLRRKEEQQLRKLFWRHRTVKGRQKSKPRCCWRHRPKVIFDIRFIFA